MNPQEQFCPNNSCEARGQIGKGNIVIHSRRERRYKCKQCNSTFVERKGSALYGLKKPVELFEIVIGLVAYGCPMAAIVAVYGLDIRTIRAWLKKAGMHCEGLHRHYLKQKRMDLIHVQADEIKVKIQAGWVWLASAMMVPTRLWLGGAISSKRDVALLKELVAQVRTVALCRPLLLAVDGLNSYLGAFRKTFRSPLPRYGQGGRHKWVAWPGITIVQVIKRISADQFHIERRIVQGSQTSCDQLLQASRGGNLINTAFIERLNATFRQRLSVLVRRTRHLARKAHTLQSSMFLLGCMYNFCTYHKGLRLPLYISERRLKWVQRTPAIAAGWTDHRWSVLELLSVKVPPPRWKPVYKRGRPSNAFLKLVQDWAS